MRVPRAPVAAGALVALAAAAAPGSASADAVRQPVTIQFASFSPTPVDALPGDTVQWSNTSTRAHTVTSDDAVFSSGTVLSGGHFSWTFDGVGTYAYHCALHPGMVGEVDVRAVTLSGLPSAAQLAGRQLKFAGRTADPSAPVQLQRSLDGTHFTTVATAAPSASGDWTTAVRVPRTADYRAVSPGGASESRRVRVQDRHVRLRSTPTGVRVTVTPSDPGGHVMLQLRLRERFGWWAVARKRLDFLSHASFKVHRRHVRVRAVLVDEDGWSPLATSPVVRFGGRAPHRGGGGHRRSGGGMPGMHMGPGS